MIPDNQTEQRKKDDKKIPSGWAGFSYYTSTAL